MKYPGRILIDLNQLKTKKKLEFAENILLKNENFLKIKN